MKKILLILAAISLLSGCISIPTAPLSADEIKSRFSGSSLEIESNGESYYFIPDGSLIYRHKQTNETRAGTWFFYSVDVGNTQKEALCLPAGRTGNTEYKSLLCYRFWDGGYQTWDLKPKLQAVAFSCDGSRSKGLRCRVVGGGFAILNKKEPADNANGRFVQRDKLTVLDQRTGLIWMKCTLGQESHLLDSCDTPPTKFRKGLDEINAYIMDFNRKGYAGHNDWRLPNIDELSDLIWCGVEAKPKEGDLCSSVVPGGKCVFR